MFKKSVFVLFLIAVQNLLLAQQSYYNDVDLNLTGLSLKNALATKIITTHTNNLDYTPDVWTASQTTDLDPANSSLVFLIYGFENGSDGDVTNDRQRDKNNNGGSSGEWNREHVFPNSLADPDLDQGGTNGPPYADAHNLRACDVQRNSSRGNKKFATGSGNSGAVTNGWYPGDEWKGDVARIVMYMYLRYGTQCLPTFVGVGNSDATPDDMIDLFLQWNADDPVSDYEKQRNAYHEDTNNSAAQGNRNPFIDNPRLATRIWGGPEAEDIWGIYTTTDSEAPTVPTNLIANTVTTFSIDFSWTASTDNIGVSSYEVFVNGNLEGSTSSTSYSVTGLDSNTLYNLTVSAKDIADNASAQSSILMVSTLQDTEAPTIPINIVVSNETDVTFKLTWDASTDNTSVTGYDIYLDNSFNSTTSTIPYTVTGLTKSTTYSVQILAKDAVGNQSALSSAINAMTTDGSTTTANELFISEYVEGSSNNKAIEIANVTQNSVDLSPYNLRRQQNGSGDWEDPTYLIGNLASGEVLVLIHNQANNQTLIDEADVIVTPNFSTDEDTFITFNGNDPVGFFKNDDLLDLIGVFNGGSGNFAKDVTLRRKSTVTGPNSTFDEVNEWDSFPQDTVDDIGNHTVTLSSFSYEYNNLKIYPNPATNFLRIEASSDLDSFQVFDLLGKQVLQGNINQTQIDVSSLDKGIYMLNLINNSRLIKTVKFINNLFKKLNLPFSFIGKI